MTVVEVGPVTVRGVAPVDDELAAEAIASIDDALMLVDDRPAAVAQVWVRLLQSAAGSADDGVLLVHPTWWSRRRVDLVLAAAREFCPSADAVSRCAVLADESGSVVELGPDQVVIAARTVTTLVRSHERAVVAAVVGAVCDSGPVLIDAPPNVEAAAALARAIVDALRERGTAASVCGPHTVGRAATSGCGAEPSGRPLRVPTRLRRPLPVLAGAVLTSLIAAAAALAPTADPPRPEATVLLTEGRVGVLVPAGWAVERITSGNGSARLRIASPAAPEVALHLTQSVLPGPQPLEEVAAALRVALGGEHAHVFTDFRPDDRRAGRPTVTYREHRVDHRTEWIVLVDTDVRIAIGCQGPPGTSGLIQRACEDAVRSAHAVSPENIGGQGTE